MRVPAPAPPMRPNQNNAQARAPDGSVGHRDPDGRLGSPAAKNPPPPASAKDAPAPATDNISPTQGIGKLSPSQEPAANYDGFTVGIDDDEETGQPLSISRRPAKRVRQKPDTTEGPSAIQSLDDSEVEKLKPKLTICRGC